MRRFPVDICKVTHDIWLHHRTEWHCKCVWGRHLRNDLIWAFDRHSVQWWYDYFKKLRIFAITEDSYCRRNCWKECCFNVSIRKIVYLHEKSWACRVEDFVSKINFSSRKIIYSGSKHNSSPFFNLPQVLMIWICAKSAYYQSRSCLLFTKLRNDEENGAYCQFK